jgi:serine/threonine protein kinase
VAIKVAAPGGERALAAEAAHLRRCAHPAVVRALGSCWALGGAPALVLEHLSGGCLDDRIALSVGGDGSSKGPASSSRRPPLDWRGRVRVCHQLASALAHFHCTLGVVHCDIKPGNVLLDGAGNAVLIDLGVARPLVGDASAAAAAVASAAQQKLQGGGGRSGGSGGGMGAASHLRALTAGVANGGVAQMHGWCGTK